MAVAQWSMGCPVEPVKTVRMSMTPGQHRLKDCFSVLSESTLLHKTALHTEGSK